MKISAPTALEQFKLMTAGARELKAALIELQSAGKGGGGSSGMTRLKAEVQELKAALVTTQAEMQKMAASTEANSQATVQAKARETSAVRAAATEQKRAAAEVAAAQKEAAAEAERALQIQLRSALLTGNARVKSNLAIEASVAQQIAQQSAMRTQALAQNVAFDKRQEALQEAAAARRQAQAEGAWRRSLQRREQVLNEANAMNDAFNKRREASDARMYAQALAMNEAFNKRRQAQDAAANGESGIGRSALRGAALSGNAGFLTYGASIPAVAAGFAAGAVLKSAITDGAEFQKQMAFVKIASSEGAEAVNKVSKEVLALGGTSIFGPVELSAGMRILTQAGLSTREAFDALKPVMNLATIGEQTVGQAAETATGLMHAFGLEVKDIPHIGDAIAKAANISQTNVNEMSQAMRQASTVGKQFNVTVDQTAAMLAVLAQTNIRGSSAGTALTNMLKEMDPASTKAQRAFRDLNIETQKAGGGMKPVMELLQEFSVKFNDLNQSSQNRMADEMFNNRGMKAFINLLSQANGDLPKFLDLIKNSNGYLQESVKILENTAWGAWKQFVGAFETSTIRGFEQGSEMLTNALKGLRDVVASPEFVSAVAMLVKLFAMAASVPKLVINAPPVTPMEGASLLGNSALNRMSRFLNPQDAALGPMDITPKDLSFNQRYAASQKALAKQIEEQSASAGKRNLERRNADDEALKKAQAAEADAQFQRERRQIEQSTNFALSELEARHRGGLISEVQYNAQLAVLNNQREAASIAAAESSIAKLAKTREALFRHDAAGRQGIDTRIANEKARRDEMVAESAHVKALSRIRLDAEEKAVQDSTRKVLEKHTEENRLVREQADMALRVRLMPETVAAGYNADFSTRKSFQSDLLAVNAEIAKKKLDQLEIDKQLADQGEGANIEEYMAQGRILTALIAKRDAILALRDAEAGRNSASAIALKTEERSMTFGWNEAFNQYEQNATNAAQNARDAFTAGTNGMVQDIENFAKTGKISIAGFAQSFIGALLHIQAVRAATGVMSLITNSFPFLGGGNNGVAAAKTPGASDVFNVSSVGVGHTGGMVGALRDSRSISMSAFAGAPRFHGGGIVGGEVPIIAKHGEGVFTEGQMRAMAPAGGNVINIEVNVNGDQSSTSVDGSGAASALAEMIAAGALAVIQKQQRPGGALARV